MTDLQILKMALLGAESQVAKIREMIAGLEDNGNVHASTAEPAVSAAAPVRKKRRMSAAGRKAIAEAQRKRWAEAKKKG
jgi:hypothetical protein